MNDFEYAAATTVDEAVSLLAARGERARILAGGTDILVQLREGLREADLVVDIKRIPEVMAMRYLPHEPSHGLSLGAAVPCHRIYQDTEVRGAYAGLADAARIIGGWQIQGRASIGGNLCNSSPAADSVPILIAYHAVCHLAGPDGRRSVPVGQFCTGPGKNVLRRGEFLVSLELPPQGPGTGAHYLRFIPRNEMDIAVVGVGAWVRLNPAGDTIVEGRIGLGAVAPTAVLAVEASRFLANQPATEATFAAAGELAKDAAKPISDKRAPADYRVHLVGVLTRRALTEATARARRHAK